MELAEWLDIVLQYLKVLAWPLVVLVLALVYRKPVVTLLQRLKKYSGWGQTVELGDLARDLSEESLEVLSEAAPADAGVRETASPAEPRTTDTEPTDPRSYPDSSRHVAFPRRLSPSQRIFTSYLSSLEPKAYPAAARRMIDDAWAALNSIASQLCTELELPLWETTNLTVLAHSLSRRGLVSPATVNVALGLDELRRGINKADDSELTLYVVRDFIDTAENLSQALQQTLNSVTLTRLLDEPDPSEPGDDPQPDMRP